MAGSRAGGATIVLLLLLIAPSAYAAPIRVASPDPVAVEGLVSFQAREGGLVALDGQADFEALFAGAAGTLTIYAWERVRGPVVGSPLPADRAKDVFELHGADLRLSARGELVEVRLVPQGGVVEVRSPVPVRAAGDPAWLERPRLDDPSAADPDRLAVPWEAGWAFAGDHVARDTGAIRGFPRLESAHARAHGLVAIQIFGGTLSFLDDEGHLRAYRLGETALDETPGVVERTMVRRAVALVAIDDAHLPLTFDWGLAAPTLDWLVDGTIAWTRASGRIGDAEFHEARVAADVLGVVVPAPRGLSDARFDGDADVRSVRVGGRVSEPVELTPAATVATVAALALLGALLVKGALVALYTRTEPDRVLDSAPRRRLLALVREVPGLPQRELHRRFGGGWGSFAFHLRMLIEARYVQIVKRGGYALVVPAGDQVDAEALLPQPLARAIYSALPADGAPVALTDLARKLGTSRDLVAYHARSLESQGLVARVRIGSRSAVLRATREPQLPP